MLTVRQLIAALEATGPDRLDTRVVVEIDGRALPLRSVIDTEFEPVPGVDQGWLILRLNRASEAPAEPADQVDHHHV